MDRPFLLNLVLLGVGLLYTSYLDRTYGAATFGESLEEVPERQRRAFFIFTLILFAIYFAQFVYIISHSIRGKLVNRARLFYWILQMFIGNIVTFAFIYLAMVLLYPSQFYDRDELKESASFSEKLVEMLYYSAGTSFTLGNGDITPNKSLGRLLTILQLGTSYVVQSYLIAVVFFRGR